MELIEILKAKFALQVMGRFCFSQSQLGCKLRSTNCLTGDLDFFFFAKVIQQVVYMPFCRSITVGFVQFVAIFRPLFSNNQ